jgi:hypothetical protein
MMPLVPNLSQIKFNLHLTVFLQGRASESRLAHGTPKTTEVIEAPQPLHNKWNIKWNTNISLSFTYVTFKNKISYL